MPGNGEFTNGPERGGFGLTALDREIIALMMAGHTKKEMTVRLGMGRQALRRQIRGICQRLDVDNEFELVLFAHYHRLNDLEKVHAHSARKLSKAAGA